MFVNRLADKNPRRMKRKQLANFWNRFLDTVCGFSERGQVSLQKLEMNQKLDHPVGFLNPLLSVLSLAEARGFGADLQSDSKFRLEFPGTGSTKLGCLRSLPFLHPLYSHESNAAPIPAIRRLRYYRGNAALYFLTNSERNPLSRRESSLTISRQPLSRAMQRYRIVTHCLQL